MLEAKSVRQPSHAALIRLQSDLMRVRRRRTGQPSDSARLTRSREAVTTAICYDCALAHLIPAANRPGKMEERPLRRERSGWRRWCERILVASSALAVACLHTAHADEPASKQLRFVVNVAAGSSIDSRARVIAHALGERLKQQVIVDNRPGAGGTIGAAYVAKAPPDGTTLLFTNDSIAINPQVYRDPGYDHTKDFVPVTQAYVSAMVLVAGPAAKIGSVRELVAQA